MKQYLNMVSHVLESGKSRGDRTGTGTIGVFGHQERYDLSEYKLPLVTTKKVFTRGLIEELLWMLRGSTNNEELTALNVHIWDGWALTKEHFKFSEGKRIELLRQKTATIPLDEIQKCHSTHPETWADVIDFAIECNAKDVLANLCFNFKIPEYDIFLSDGLQTGELGPIYGKQWRSMTNLIVITPEEFEAGNAKVPGTYIYKDEYFDTLRESTVYLVNKPIDQIADLIKGLKTNPFSRRHVVTAWLPSDLPDETKSPHQNVLDGKAALASCHCLFQFYVEDLTLTERIKHCNDASDREEAEFLTSENLEFEMRSYRHIDSLLPKDEKEAHEFLTKNCGTPTQRLSCQLYQRSCDAMLGAPFNIASYSLLTMMLAQCVGMVPGEFIHTLGDLHIYKNHIAGAQEQLLRNPLPLPTVTLNPAIKNIFDFTINDITINNYESHPAIKFDVSI
jgi:thymidylate synthase